MNIYFDIETSPLPADQIKAPEFDASKFQELEPFDESAVKLGATKDPEKVRAKIQQAKLKHAEAVLAREQKIKDAEAAHHQKHLDGAALKATTGRVLMIAVRKDGKNIAISHDDEARLLTEWWHAVSGNYQSGHQFVGFNIFGFDLPFLIRRSWHLEVSVPSWIRNGRYWSQAFVDLMDWWQMGNRTEYIKLDDFDRFTGGAGKTGSGADFYVKWQTDREVAIAYAMNDVEILERLARRLGIEDRRRDDSMGNQQAVPQSLTVTGGFGEGSGVIWD